jgi:3-oxoacyl-[acyl-carrier-protein] synthase-1
VTTRAFVAGAGAVSCFGIGTAALLDAVFEGRSGVRPLERLRPVDDATRVAAELPRAVVAAAGGAPELPAWLARTAAREALGEAAAGERRTLGLVLATTKADLGGVCGPGAGFGSPWRLCERLAADLGVGGPAAAVSSACASGLSAIAIAARWLADAMAGAVLVVGVDVLGDFVLRGFRALLALDPEPCRPFDRARNGLSLGEGAGALLLRAAPPAAGGDAIAVLGCGESNDAHGVTAPRPDGDGLAHAIDAALAAAGADAASIDYVHLHGTGTLYNDAMELAALQRAFAAPPPCSGSKAQLGHTLGAAGVLESLVAIEALRRGRAPGNARLVAPDAPAGFPLLRRAAALPRARRALKVAAGFGGIDAAVVFGR